MSFPGFDLIGAARVRRCRQRLPVCRLGWAVAGALAVIWAIAFGWMEMVLADRQGREAREAAQALRSRLDELAPARDEVRRHEAAAAAQRRYRAELASWGLRRNRFNDGLDALAQATQNSVFVSRVRYEVNAGSAGSAGDADDADRANDRFLLTVDAIADDAVEMTAWTERVSKAAAVSRVVVEAMRRVTSTVHRPAGAASGTTDDTSGRQGNGDVDGKPNDGGQGRPYLANDIADDIADNRADNAAGGWRQLPLSLSQIDEAGRSAMTEAPSARTVFKARVYLHSGNEAGQR